MTLKVVTQEICNMKVETTLEVGKMVTIAGILYEMGGVHGISRVRGRMFKYAQIMPWGSLPRIPLFDRT